MPRLSFRNPKVGRLFSKWTNLRRWRFFKFAMGQDPFDLTDVMLEQEAKCRFRLEEASRYSTRGKYRNGDASTIFEEDLKEDPPWLNDAEFKDKYRMTRSSFRLLVDLIKDHRVFKGGPRRQQAPVEHQLMTLLCFLGTEGNGMSNRKGRSLFRVSKGTVGVYKDRVVKAILDCLFNDYVKWPDPEECRIISERIRAEFGLPNCIGVADGMLLPLAFRPSTEDYADYKGRKMLYTLTMLVVNDDQSRLARFNSR